MAATSSDSNTFNINPCDVLVEPLFRPLKEFGVVRLVKSFKIKGNLDTSMICVVKRDKEEDCPSPYLIIEGSHRTTALQRIIKEYEVKGRTPPDMVSSSEG